MARIEKLENGETIIRDDWGELDIQMVARDYFETTLTKDQVLQAMDIVVEGFDASIGVNWDVIEAAVDEVLRG
jgi:hypothetical protein